MGATLASGEILVAISGVSGAEGEAAASAGVWGVLALLGGLASLIGVMLFGAAAMRGDGVPRWAGVRLVV